MRTLFVSILVSIITLAVTAPVAQAVDVNMGAITCGQTQSGTIAAAEEQHVWTFEGQAGDGIVLACEPNEGELQPYLALYSQDGNSVEFSTRNDLVHWVLREDGPCKVVVYDRHLNQTGSYNLTVTNLAECEIASIGCGQIRSGALEIGDFDVYEFEGQAGDGIVLTCEPTEGELRPYLALYSQDGNSVEFSIRNDLVHWVLREDGPCKVVVYDRHLNQTGSYNLTVTNLAECEITPIGCGQTRSGTLEIGDFDVYEFEGQAGDGIRLACEPNEGELRPYLALYSQDGNSVEFTLRDNMVYWVLGEDGPYKVVVYDRHLNQTGSYDLTLDCDDPNIYVDDNANGNNDGTSWANAYNYLQDALVDAAGRDAEVSIYVAQGVYVPDLSTGDPLGTGDRAATFALSDGVAIIGGYAGVAGDDPDARDVEAYETILSGDLLGNDTGDPALLTDNSYHVVTTTNTSETTLLDGVTITAGNADANQPDHTGGGLFQQGGVLMVRDCTFVANTAGWTGGGATCQHGNVTYEGCSFVGNKAAHAGGLYYLGFGDATVEDCFFAANEVVYEGGALALDTGAVQVNACTFQDNVAGWGGGAIAVHPGDRAHTITDCQFIGNTALGQTTNAGGGAISDRGPGTTVSRCLFQGNRAFGNIDELAGLGGAVYCDGTSTNLVNCTFAGNYANVGNALACDEYVEDANATAVNCIFWDGGNELWISPGSVLAVSYSNLRPDAQSDTAADYIDPLFVSPGHWGNPSDPNLLLVPEDPGALWVAGDYHLMSRAGRWDPAQEGWAIDSATSACIDAGDPNSPCEEEPQPNGSRINLGVYGGTPQASKSADLILTISSTGGGSVSAPGEGEFAYASVEDVFIAAVADVCYDFVGWSGTAVEAGKVADPNMPETTVTVDADYTLVANFVIRQVQVALSSSQGGLIQVPGEGVFTYECGACVAVEAVPEACYAFSRWVGTAVEQGLVADPNDPNTTICVDADCTLEAEFSSIDFVLTVASGPGGSVMTPGEGEFDCDCGASVPVLAVADEHRYFTQWSGTAVEAGKVADPADPNTTVLMDASYTLQANFAVEQHTLKISSAGGGWVYVMAIEEGSVKQGIGDRTYALDHGTLVLILPIPAPGYTFQSYANASHTFYSTTESWTFTLQDDFDLEATFVPEPGS